MNRMTATTRARPARSRPAAFAVPRSADVLAPVAVAAWCAILLALTWNTWGDLGRDTGYDLLAAARVADGDLPYVDYIYFYGPVSHGCCSAGSTRCWSSVEVAIALGLALAGLIVALTFALGRRLAGPVGGGLAAALAATAALGILQLQPLCRTACWPCFALRRDPRAARLCPHRRAQAPACRGVARRRDHADPAQLRRLAGCRARRLGRGRGCSSRPGSDGLPCATSRRCWPPWPRCRCLSMARSRRRPASARCCSRTSTRRSPCARAGAWSSAAWPP